MNRAQRACALLLGALLLPSFVGAYTSPGNPTGHVNDFAGVLSAETRQSLEVSLAAFAASSSNEIAVAIVSTIGDDYIENYAVSLFEEWGIGTDKNDNGVLLLIASEDRQLRIEVGYGLEGALPDSVADRIIRDDIIPYLKEGDFDGAVTKGVESITAATRNEYVGTGGSDIDLSGISEMFWPLFVFGIIGLQWIVAIFARTKSWWLGGIVGVVLGSVVSSFFSLWVLVGFMMTLGFALFGLFFDFVVSSTYQHSKKYNVNTPWWAGGNSGGFGGGRRGGGGFGGFGGGMSGGGGASGRW